MKSIVDVLKERLPKELNIKDIKEFKSLYRIIFEYNGSETKCSLTKYYALGCENQVVDDAINLAMATILMEQGDYQKAKEWHNKIINK